MAREVRIYFPKCPWEPRPADRWLCSPCGCLRNTFEAGGMCPDCGKTGKEAVCLSCRAWSPHADWYHQFGEDPIEEVVDVEPLGEGE